MSLNVVLAPRAALQPFFDQKVKKVVVAAPVKDSDPVLNVVFGCNEVKSLTHPARILRLMFTYVQQQHHLEACGPESEKSVCPLPACESCMWGT